MSDGAVDIGGVTGKAVVAGGASVASVASRGTTGRAFTAWAGSDAPSGLS